VFGWTEDMTVEYVQRVSRCWQVSREICEHFEHVAALYTLCVCFRGIRPIRVKHTVYCCEIVCIRLLFEEVSMEIDVGLSPVLHQEL